MPNAHKPTRSNNRLVHIVKVLYVFLVVLILTALFCELYLVLDRRNSNKQVKEAYYAKNAFSATDTQAEGQEPLWEVEWEKYRPNTEIKIVDNESNNLIIDVKINRFGYRTKEFKEKKSPHVYRIITIGASTTFDGITNHTTYPAQLEKRLKAAHPGKDIEVLNFGISGTLSDFWISRYDELFRYEPDLIIQYNGANDICWKYFPRHNNSCTSEIKHMVLKQLNRSMLFQKLFPSDPDFFKDCMVSTFQNFKNIAMEANSRGVDYIVGTFAAPDCRNAPDLVKRYLDYNVERTWGIGFNLKFFNPYRNIVTTFNSRLKKFAQQHNFHTAEIDAVITNPYIFTDICHMNQDGIDLMAETFAKKVSAIIEKRQRKSENY